MKRFICLLVLAAMVISAAGVSIGATGEEKAFYPIEGEWFMLPCYDPEPEEMTFDEEGNIYHIEEDMNIKVCRSGEVYMNDVRQEGMEVRFTDLSEDAFVLCHTEPGYDSLYAHMAVFRVGGKWYSRELASTERYLIRNGMIIPYRSGNSESNKQYIYDGEYLYIISEGRYSRYEIVPYGEQAFALVSDSDEDRFSYQGERPVPRKQVEYFVISAGF